MSKDNQVEENVTDEDFNPAAASAEDIANAKGVADEELDSLFDKHTNGEEVEWPDQKAEEGDEGEPEAEEENPPVENQPSAEDKEKERKAMESLGNKNYIDNDLVNSIEDKDLRQKVWKVMNAAQSNYNRLYPREQEINRLRNEVNQLKERREQQPDPVTQFEKEQQEKKRQAEIASLKEDYPDLEPRIDALAESKYDQKSQELMELLDRKYGPMQQQWENQSRQFELQQLEQTAYQIFDTEKTGVSYRDVVASPDFSAWLETQPESIKALANADTAAESIRVLQLFDTDYSRLYREQHGSDWRQDLANQAHQAEETHPSANSQNDATASNRDSGPNEADKLAAKREQTRRRSVVGITPSRSAANSDTSLDDPDSLFDHYAKQSNRNRR